MDGYEAWRWRVVSSTAQEVVEIAGNTSKGPLGARDDGERTGRWRCTHIIQELEGGEMPWHGDGAAAQASKSCRRRLVGTSLHR